MVHCVDKKRRQHFKTIIFLISSQLLRHPLIKLFTFPICYKCPKTIELPMLSSLETSRVVLRGSAWWWISIGHCKLSMAGHCTAHLYLFIYFDLYFILFYFILLYNTVLILPYINMNLPWLYTCSSSWTPLPPPSPYHLSGSSQCTSPKHPVSCIKPRLAIPFLYDIIHV